MIEFSIAEEVEMLALGARLAAACADSGAVIFLHGELGAGKTTLVRGFLRGLGHHGKVKSPTYTLVEPYELGQRRIYHFDLYRLADPHELDYIGIRDFLEQDAILLVEWPERGTNYLPAPDIHLHIGHLETRRRVRFEAGTPLGKEIIARMVSGERMFTLIL